MFSAKSTSQQPSLITGETISLFIPVLILPFVAWEFYVGASIPYFMAALTTNIVEGALASVGHTGLTWGLLFMTPEGRGWWNESRDSHVKWRLIALTAIIFLGTAAIFYVNNSQVVTIFFSIYTVISLHHGITQVQGIAFAYSYQNTLTADEREKVEQLHRRQKLAFKFLLAIASLYPIDNILDLGLLDSFEKKFATFLVGLMIAGWLVLSNRRLAGPQRNKMIFLLRILNVPVGVFSMFAAHSIRIFHALEYMFIYRRIMSFSTYPKLFKRSTTIIVAAALYFFVTFLWLFTFFNTQEGLSYIYNFENGKPWWFCILGSLAVTRALMHFYLDRIIFQMSNPVSKKWWGPLLAGRTPALETEKVS